MRERRRTLLLTVLALTFVTLLVTPIAAVAAGLSASISMDPPTAGPGDTVAVAGTGFPAQATVELQLLTPEGLRYVDTITTEDGGSFDRAVSLPADIAAGLWEMQATTAGDISAGHAFDATVGLADAAAGATASSGNSAADIAVMLVISVVLAAIVGGIGFIYYQLRLADLQPGMATGDDPIWSGSEALDDPQATATEQPAWLSPPADAVPAGADGPG